MNLFSFFHKPTKALEQGDECNELKKNASLLVVNDNTDALPELQIVRRKVRTVRAVVHNDGSAELVIPLTFPNASIGSIVRYFEPWVRKKQQKIQQQKHTNHQPGNILYRGHSYQFIASESLGKTIVIDPASSCISSGYDLLDKTVRTAWLRFEAEKVLPARLSELSVMYGFTYNNVTIRNTRSQWGSCSVRRNISLSLWLMSVPPSVSDYVLLHELVHTEHLNHSRSFWLRVAEVCPNYRHAVQWLRTEGRYLDR